MHANINIHVLVLGFLQRSFLRSDRCDHSSHNTGYIIIKTIIKNNTVNYKITFLIILSQEVCNGGDSSDEIRASDDGHRCKFCHRIFRHPSRLGDHILVHSKAKPFKCKYPACKSAYKSKRSLRRHEMSHKFDQVYNCNYCDFASHVELRVIRHSKIHEKPSKKCKFCKRKFMTCTQRIIHTRVCFG